MSGRLFKTARIFTYIVLQPLAVGVMLLFVFHYLLVWWHSAKFQLPSPLEYSQVIYYDSFDGWISACSYKMYRLKPETVASLREKKLEFLGSMPWVDGIHSRNPYDQWQMTPLKIDTDHYATLKNDRNTGHIVLDALKGSNGCDIGSQRPPEFNEFDIMKSFEGSDNYYSFSQNREGLVFIDTKLGLALVIYWG